jgi:hypothetical protein
VVTTGDLVLVVYLAVVIVYLARQWSNYARRTDLPAQDARRGRAPKLDRAA